MQLHKFSGVIHLQINVNRSHCAQQYEISNETLTYSDASRSDQKVLCYFKMCSKPQILFSRHWACIK